MSLSTGSRLGPYEIQTALGAGGMGEVYKARDTRLDRTVAIKILPDALAADPQFRDRFDREARTISQLDHPHIFQSVSKDTKQDLWVLTMTGERKAAPWLVTRFNEADGRFSPDSRWIAYVSDESGQREVYVQPFPATSAKWQVSVGGGVGPRWSGDGRELFYASLDRKLMSVAVTYQPAFEVGAPKPMFDLKRATDVAVSRTGRRFLVNQPVVDAASGTLNVVLNWPAALPNR